MSECTRLEREYLDLVKSGCTDRKKILAALHAVELAGVSPEWEEKTVQARVRTIQANIEFNEQWKICSIQGGGDYSAFSTLWERIEKEAQRRVENKDETSLKYWYGSDK